MAYSLEFRRRLDPHPLSDKQSNNVRIYNTDPGLVRTPGSRRWITMGCLWGVGNLFRDMADLGVGFER